jgi:hypothetical protein
MGNAWGLVGLEDGRPTLEVMQGEVTLRRFGLEGQAVAFDAPRRLTAGDRLAP